MGSAAVKVSVVLTTFNHGRYVRQALESVLNQRAGFAYEVLVGEDASTDDTRAVVLACTKGRPGDVRLFLHDRNIGGHANFSLLYRAARGQYVAWIEGDDFWTDPGKLGKQAAFLDAHPDFALCFHPVEVVREGAPSPVRRLSNRNQAAVTTADDLARHNYIHTVSSMFRNRVVADLPAWVHRLPAGDWPFHLLVAQHGKIGFIDEVMGVYRMHAGGVWSSRPRLENWEDSIRVAEACREHLALPGLDAFVVKRALRGVKLAWEQRAYAAAARFGLRLLRRYPSVRLRRALRAGRESGRPGG